MTISYVCCFCRSKGHKVTKIDLNSDPSLSTTLPPMDVILLKMTDEIVKVSSDPVSATQVANARKLIELYPKATLVDSLDAQAGTTDRESMHHFFEKLNALPACT